jgi:hypothetical protein
MSREEKFKDVSKYQSLRTALPSDDAGCYNKTEVFF